MELEDFKNPLPKSQVEMVMVNKKVWEKLQEDLEEARQIVNSERHILIVKKCCYGINKKEEKRLAYLQGKIREWWPRLIDKKRLNDINDRNCGDCSECGYQSRFSSKCTLGRKND